MIVQLGLDPPGSAIDPIRAAVCAVNAAAGGLEHAVDVLVPPPADRDESDQNRQANWNEERAVDSCDCRLTSTVIGTPDPACSRGTWMRQRPSLLTSNQAGYKLHHEVVGAVVGNRAARLSRSA